MNNEIRSKSVHNNRILSVNKFSKRIKPVEVFTLGADRTIGGTDSNADWGNWNVND